MEAVFVRLLNMSIAATWLILIIIILKLLFRRLSRTVHCLMWIAVVIRLICPLYFESSSGLIPEFIPDNKPVNNTVLIENEPVLRANILVNFNDNIQETMQAPYVEVIQRNNIYYDIVHIGAIVWIVGMAVILGYSVISYVKLKTKILESVRYRDNIWRCDHVNTPFIMGFLKPRIIIPSSLDENTIKYVVAHEMAHLERKDYLWKPMAVLILAVYWINPVMWLAYLLFCRDIEFACDDKVVYCKTDEYVKEYMNALLNCSVPKYKLVTYSVAFGEISVKRRIKRIVAYKRPYIFMAELLILMSLALCYSFFVLSPENEMSTKLSKETKESIVWDFVPSPSSMGYTYEGDVPRGECGTEEITYEEFINIYMEGKEIRLDDFTKYKYEYEKVGNVTCAMRMPLAGYDDVYVSVDYYECFDGSIDISSPYLWYESSASEKYFFLADQMCFYAFTQLEPRYDDMKTYVNIVWSSVTDDSLIVEVCNNTEEFYIWDFSYEIYEINDGKDVLIASEEGEQINYQSYYPDMVKIELEDGVKFEEGKQYLLKYGKNKSGYIYSEIMFVK